MEFDREKIAAYALAKQQEYLATKQTAKVNFLPYGMKGAGKTHLVLTCPKPVHVDMFDPGGTKAPEFLDALKKGEIIIDNSWSHDSWKKPWAFRAWEGEHRKRKEMGYYDAIGTYFLDSLSTFGESIMYAILMAGSKKTGPRTGQSPELQDHYTLQMTLVDYMSDLMYLPCHVVVTGHMTLIQDEVTGAFESGLALPGKAAHKTAIPFDEMYVARRTTDNKFVLLTQNDGRYQATTRIGSRTFQKEEESNITALLKKAGMPYEDKPLLTAGGVSA